MSDFDERDFLCVVLQLAVPSAAPVAYGRMLQLIDHLDRLDWQTGPTDAAERHFRNKVLDLAPRMKTGRMRQIVSHLWYRDDPLGAVTPDGSGCYGTLRGEAGILARAGAEGDRLFAGMPRVADLRATFDAAASGDPDRLLAAIGRWSTP